MNFKPLYAAGRVSRYHTADVPAQSLAEHSWGVAMICARIYPQGDGYGPLPARLLQAALLHDLAEVETGDVPAPTKWTNPHLDDELEDVETRFELRHGYRIIMLSLTAREERILKWADMFELVIYNHHQVKMGNTYAQKLVNRGLEHLRTLGFPTTEAEELFYEHDFSNPR